MTRAFPDVRQSHTTIAVIEKHTDGTYVLKALKQKLYVDGLCYLLQEIYGIENKNHDKVTARSATARTVIVSVSRSPGTTRTKTTAPNASYACATFETR